MYRFEGSEYIYVHTWVVTLSGRNYFVENVNNIEGSA